MKLSLSSHTFRAFGNRNYSLFFSGQSVSLIGTWMQRTGVSWMVYTITHSSFMLGITIFASQFPSFLFSLLGGYVSDKFPRYKILLATQTASMLQAILLAVLVLTNHFAIWQILVLSVVLGIINAFDMPARQPLVHQLVSNKEDIPNALALNSSMVNLARLVGPALSGLVLGRYGAGICFLLNALSFLAVIVSLLLMKLPSFIPPVAGKEISTELAEGFAYLKRTPAISIVLLMITCMSLLVIPYDTLLPVFAKVIYKGDAATYGYIYSFIGVGALCAALFLASLKPGTNLKTILLANTAVLGVALMLFSHLSYFPLAMFVAAITGFSSMAQVTIIITTVQVESDAAMRGRVMSFVAMAYFGMLPVGSLLLGGMSQLIGAPNAIFCQGIFSLLIAAVFYKYLRPEKVDQNEGERLNETEGVVLNKV